MNAKILLLLTLGALAAAFLSVDAGAPPTSEILWERYQNVLLSFIRKNNDYTGLQVVTEPLEANWDVEPENLSILMDKSSRYGSIYSPSSISLSQEYESFLFNLKVGSSEATPAQLKRLENLKNAISVEQDKRFDQESKCYENFHVMSSLFSIPYIEFRQNYCAAVLDPIQRNLAYLNSDLTTMNSKVFGEHQRVSEAISSFIQTPDAGRFFETKTTLAGFLNNARAGKGNLVTFSLNSQTTLEEKRKWMKKKSSGFFIFKKKSQEIKTEYNFQSEHFNMKITGILGKIDIAPKDNWYNFNTVKTYYNNKTLWENKNKTFFGEKGTLSLFPRALYVMYNPKIILECGEKDAYTLDSMKSSSFTFGPFSSQKGSTLNIKQQNQNNYEVSINSNSNAAQIVAIDFHVFE